MIYKEYIYKGNKIVQCGKSCFIAYYICECDICHEVFGTLEKAKAFLDDNGYSLDN